MDALKKLTGSSQVYDFNNHLLSPIGCRLLCHGSNFHTEKAETLTDSTGLGLSEPKVPDANMKAMGLA